MRFEPRNATFLEISRDYEARAGKITFQHETWIETLRRYSCPESPGWQMKIPDAIRAKESSRQVVQENCIRCHTDTVESILAGPQPLDGLRNGTGFEDVADFEKARAENERADPGDHLVPLVDRQLIPALFAGEGTAVLAPQVAPEGQLPHTGAREETNLS